MAKSPSPSSNPTVQPSKLFRPPISVLDYGRPGTGKSALAATFPLPMLVLLFDPFPKAIPYMQRGKVGKIEQVADGVEIMPVADHKSGAEIITIERYFDAFVQQPTAYLEFCNRIGTLHEERDRYKTLVLDELTMLRLAATKDCQYRANRKMRDRRRVAGWVTDTLEEQLMCHLPNWPNNLVVLAHMDTYVPEGSDTILFSPAAPGRLKDRLSGVFGEVYRSYIETMGTGKERKRGYWVQTAGDEDYDAMTHIGTPDPCEPVYEALWENWGRKEEENG